MSKYNAPFEKMLISTIFVLQNTLKIKCVEEMAQQIAHISHTDISP